MEPLPIYEPDPTDDPEKLPEPNMDTRWNWRAGYASWGTNIRESEEWNAMTPEEQEARRAGLDRPLD